MIRLLAVAAVLFGIFTSTFVIIKSSGLVTIDDIKGLLLWAAQANILYLGLLVVVLLSIDIFITIPTLTIVTLSGYFMGPVFGTIFSVLGMWIAGLIGYSICRKWGDRLLLKVYRDEDKLKEMREIFNQYGVYVLVLCRAAPMLPEVVCCLSGANKMPFNKFVTFFSLGTVPYAMLVSFAGSKSTLDDPLPGIIGAISISVLLWFCWYILIKVHYRSKRPEGSTCAQSATDIDHM